MNILVSTEDMAGETWLEWRKNGIGGSDASVISGINKYKSPVELWLEKTGQIEPKETGEATYWGHVMEPIIREEFMKRTGLHVAIEDCILQHEDFPFMIANVDGIVIDEENGKEYIFEAKTASAYVFSEWDLNIPESYQLQVQHYMAVTGYEGAYVAALIGGNTFKYYFIERDDELISLLIKLESKFWDCVTNNKPPLIDGSKACSELLDRLHPMGESREMITLPESALELINRYDENSIIENAANEKKEEAINKLKELLGENELACINGRIISWSNISSERINSKLLKSEQPELYSQYTSKSNYRRFTIK